MKEVHKIALSRTPKEWQRLTKSTSNLDRAFYYNALKRLAEALQKGDKDEIETWTFNAEELKKHLEAKGLFEGCDKNG
jgi:GH15 family glucan-1,4-alpha-glucosidase